jgi:hypothetical protein
MLLRTSWVRTGVVLNLRLRLSSRHRDHSESEESQTDTSKSVIVAPLLHTTSHAALYNDPSVGRTGPSTPRGMFIVANAHNKDACINLLRTII